MNFPHSNNNAIVKCANIIMAGNFKNKQSLMGENK